jgi:hypothetical protein
VPSIRRRPKAVKNGLSVDRQIAFGSVLTELLEWIVVRIGTVPAGQRIPDHRVTVRSALSLGEPDRAERRGRDKTAKTRGNGQRNRDFITVCRTLNRGLIGRAAAATASWSGGKAGSHND